MEGLNGIYEQNICIKNIYSENIFFDENYNPKIYGVNFYEKNDKSIVQDESSKSKITSEKNNEDLIINIAQLLFRLVTGKEGISYTDEDVNYYFIKNGKYDLKKLIN